MTNYSATDGYLPQTAVLKRYRRSHMWLCRIRGRDSKRPNLYDPTFPKPAMTINGRAFWRIEDLQKWEASHAAS